jgi:hypothetical protein
MAEKKKTSQVPPDVEEHQSAANEADILKYWTEENQEAACPVPLPVPKADNSSPPGPLSKRPDETK